MVSIEPTFLAVSIRSMIIEQCYPPSHGPYDADHDRVSLTITGSVKMHSFMFDLNEVFSCDYWQPIMQNIHCYRVHVLARRCCSVGFDPGLRRLFLICTDQKNEC